MSNVAELQDNQLLTAQLEEARSIETFLHSPAWTWLKLRLEAVVPRLTAFAAGPSKDRDDRMLALGKLALIQEILARPAMLSDLARRYETALDHESIPLPRETGGGFGSPGIL